MANRYKLTCPSCHEAMAVGPPQAGSSLTCHCGKQLEVPTFRAMRELPIIDPAEKTTATAWGFHQLIERAKMDVIQPDVSRCGGLSQVRKILWEAERAGVDVCPHAWLTDLLTATSLHVNACLARSLFLEYNVSASPMLRTSWYCVG